MRLNDNSLIRIILILTTPNCRRPKKSNAQLWTNTCATHISESQSDDRSDDQSDDRTDDQSDDGDDQSDDGDDFNDGDLWWCW